MGHIRGVGMLFTSHLACAVLVLSCLSGIANAQGMANVTEDRTPVPDEAINATTLWRFVADEWPVSDSEDTEWGWVSVVAFSSEYCLGKELWIHKTTTGGGNWTNGLKNASLADEYSYDDYDYDDVIDGDYTGSDDGSDDGSDYGSDDASDDYGGADEDAQMEGDENSFTSSLGSNIVYSIFPSTSCKDPDIHDMPPVPVYGGYTECQKRCNLVEPCRAFTYNIATHMCYLKEECFKLRSDRKRLDISGKFLKDLADEAQLNIPAGGGKNAEMRASVERMDANLAARVQHWENETESVRDSILGGAYVQVRLHEPAIVRCLQFVVPPRLKAQFPQAARIEFSMDNGTSWNTSQALDISGQEALLVKTVSKHANKAFLEPVDLPPSPPLPPPSPPPPSFDTYPHRTISEVISVTMRAAQEAAKDKGVTFDSPRSGFAFTAGMMLVGAATSCCCIILCRRRMRHIRKQPPAWESNLSYASEGEEDIFSDIELADRKNVLSATADTVINGVVSTFSPSKKIGSYKKDDS